MRDTGRDKVKIAAAVSAALSPNSRSSSFTPKGRPEQVRDGVDVRALHSERRCCRVAQVIKAEIRDLAGVAARLNAAETYSLLDVRKTRSVCFAPRLTWESITCRANLPAPSTSPRMRSSAGPRHAT